MCSLSLAYWRISDGGEGSSVASDPMSSTPAKKPSKFSAGFPKQFLASNVGVFIYLIAMVAVFELFLAPALTPLFRGAVRTLYFYSANLNMKSRMNKWLSANGDFPGDRAFLRGCGSALFAAAALNLLFTIEDYLA